MAQSHVDRPDHDDDAQDFVRRLEERAGAAMSAQTSTIAGGVPGEEVQDQWQARGVHVRQLPPDEQGILRISIGGGPRTPVQLNYCTFRGPHGDCVDLLRKVLAAMEFGRDD